MDHSLVSGFCERRGDRRFHGRHPRLELALLILGLEVRRLRLENVLLAGGLEVARDGVLQGRFVFLDHASHAFELFDPPRVGACDIARKVGLLRIKVILEPVHRTIPWIGGLLLRLEDWLRTAGYPEREPPRACDGLQRAPSRV